MISTAFALVSSFVYNFGLSFFDTLYISMFLPSFFLMALKKEAILPTLKRLLLLNIFIVFVSASAFFTGNKNLAYLIFLRSNALLLFTLLMFYEKTLFDIAASMQTLKVPNKLTSIFFFVAKFIIIIKEEFDITKKVMKIRNFKSKSNVFSYIIYANVIGMIIVKCFERAEKLKNSMILRNFQGKIYSTKDEKFTKVDLVIFILVIVSLFIHVGEIKL